VQSEGVARLLLLVIHLFIHLYGSASGLG
jgi:hypothetical protein